MKPKQLYTALFVMALIAAPAIALASSTFLPVFQALYPDARTPTNPCFVCHTSFVPAIDPPRNNYGANFGANLLVTTDQGVRNALRAIEPLDSDLDSFTNLTEVSVDPTRSLQIITTFPGDGTSIPARILFVDNFANGRANGAPNWQRINGAWSGINGVLTSSPNSNDLNDLILANPPVQNPIRTFGAGVIQTRFRMVRTPGAGRNASIIFGFDNTDPNNTRFRFVRVTPTRISIGQVGVIGPDTAGIKVTTPFSTPVNTFHQMRVQITAQGRVSVFVGRTTVPSVPSASFQFLTNATGRVGFQAIRARAQFDDFFSSRP